MSNTRPERGHQELQPPNSRHPERRRPGIRVGLNSILRFLLELFALFSLGYWGYLAWPFPWPALAFMIGTPLFAIVVWMLFRSPKAILPVDIVGRGIVEIAVMGTAVIAWAMLGHPIIATVFGVVALLSGAVNLREESRQERR